MKLITILIPIIVLLILAALVIIPHFLSKLELTDDWHLFIKKWSTWLNLVGTSVSAFVIFAPDTLLKVWSQIPDDMKSALPPSYVRAAGLILAALAIAASVVKQKKLEAERAAIVAMKEQK